MALRAYLLFKLWKKICGFKNKNSRIFKNFNYFTKIKIFKTHFLKFLSFINLPCGHVMSHKKCGPNRFSHFDVFIGYKQTDRQAKFIYRFPCFSSISSPKNELFPKFSKENTKQSCLNSAQAYHTFYGANLFTKRGMAKINA